LILFKALLNSNENINENKSPAKPRLSEVDANDTAKIG
jgi:hypothetical protein